MNNEPEKKGIIAKLLSKKRIKKTAILLTISLLSVFIIAGAAYIVMRWIANKIAEHGEKYTHSVNIDLNSGSISTEVTAQELWNNMIKQGLEIDKYLNGPSDLEKLLNAELVTQLPDMRPNVDTPIDWDSIIDSEWVNSSTDTNNKNSSKLNDSNENEINEEQYLEHAKNVEHYIWSDENKNLYWNGGTSEKGDGYGMSGGGDLAAYADAVDILWNKDYSLREIHSKIKELSPETLEDGKNLFKSKKIEEYFNIKVERADRTVESIKAALSEGKVVTTLSKSGLWIGGNKWNSNQHWGLIFYFDGTHFHMKAGGSGRIKDGLYTPDQLKYWLEKDSSQFGKVYTFSRGDGSGPSLSTGSNLSNSLQGIIRFRRHDRDGNEYYLTYASPEQFQEWVNAYNNDGDQEAGKMAMTHFTLKKGGSGISNINITGEGGDAIAEAAVQLACSVAKAPDQNLLKAQWPGTRIYNDKTAAYVDARENLIKGKSSDGGDYASCDMAVATAVRYSKVDPNMEYNTTPNIWTYLRNSSEWEDVGEYTRPNSPTNLQPGDVLLSGEPYGHILIYTGNEAVKKKYPDSKADAYEAGYQETEGESYYPRLFEISKDPRNHITFTIFRHISANNTNDSSTDISEKILQATNNVGWPGPQKCLKWVDDVYEAAGISPDRKDTARQAGEAHIISTSSANIPVGAAVYAEGSGPAGHVGIYIGNGKVKDSINSGLRETDLQSWMNEQQWIGWGWEDGNQTRGSNASSSSSSNSNNTAPSNYTGQLDTSQSGDGWDGTYTSSAGITYRSYHQGQGPWAGDCGNYNMPSNGCGPTATAIIASGLIADPQYTPGDIAPIATGGQGPAWIDGRGALSAALDQIGLTHEIVEGPSTEEIVNQLRAGKVLIRSCPAETIFCRVDHFVAVVDVNDQGQVYVLNIGEPGWYDPAELVSGAKYAIAIDAKPPANTGTSTGNSNGPGYEAVVATFKEINKTVSYDGPDIQEAASTMGVSLDDTDQYVINTTSVNYEALVQPYILPFSFLTDLLITGQSKGFVMDLAKLAYKSDLEVSIYDNVTTVTDVDKWTYSKVTDGKITGNVKCDDFIENVNHTHLYKDGDPISEENGHIDREVITKTDSVAYALTRANTWFVDYKQGYEPNVNKGDTQTGQTSKPNQKPGPWKTEEGASHDCKVITDAVSRVISQANVQRENDAKAEAQSNETTLSGGQKTTTVTYTEATENDVEKNITVQKRSYFINMNDSTEDTTDISQYTAGTKSAVLKDNKSEELSPNFVTIFNDRKYRDNKFNILSATEWVFEIMKSNSPNTLEIFQYLLFKATGVDYGVTEFDIDAYLASFASSSRGAAGGVLSITETTLSREEFVHLVQSYSAAVSNGGTSEFRNGAGTIYDICVQEHLNPVLCAAQAWQEQNWSTPVPGNYWGIGVYNGQQDGLHYDGIAGGVKGWCNHVNGILRGDGDSADVYRDSAARYATVNNKFKGDMSTIYDVFSAWAYIGDGYSLQAEADYAAEYVESIGQCASQIFGDGALNLNN